VADRIEQKAEPDQYVQRTFPSELIIRESA
jgi:hypothetical protein